MENGQHAFNLKISSQDLIFDQLLDHRHPDRSWLRHLFSSYRQPKSPGDLSALRAYWDRAVERTSNAIYLSMLVPIGLGFTLAATKGLGSAAWEAWIIENAPSIIIAMLGATALSTAGCI